MAADCPLDVKGWARELAELLADGDLAALAMPRPRGLWELTPQGELVARPALYPAGTL